MTSDWEATNCRQPQETLVAALPAVSLASPSKSLSQAKKNQLPGQRDRDKKDFTHKDLLD